VATAADFILDLQKTAALVGLDPPPEGWRSWAAAVRAAGQGDAPDDPAAGALLARSLTHDVVGDERDSSVHAGSFDCSYTMFTST